MIITWSSTALYLVSAIAFSPSRFVSLFLFVCAIGPLVSNAIASTTHIDEYYNFDARKNLTKQGKM